MPAIDATSKIVHESLLILMTFSHSQECWSVASTPFNRSGGFVRDAVDDRADFAHFIGDAARYFVEEIVGELGETRGKAVDAPHRPERDHVTLACVVTF